MEAHEKKLYSELRTIRKELVLSLEEEKCSPSIKPIVEDELKDINKTIEKLESGKFGLCEVSGELIPSDFLKMVPTIKSLDDVERIYQFYCKPIHS